MYFRKCGKCAKEIPFLGTYYQCSISSCKKHVYCSVDCWQYHNEVLNHKSAWAEEEKAPREPSNSSDSNTPRRRIVTSNPNATSVSSGQFKHNSNIPHDILIVASKLKQYVKEKHDLNTSANVMEALSDIVRNHVDNAVNKARSEGRKTLMDRDF